MNGSSVTGEAREYKEERSQGAEAGGDKKFHHKLGFSCGPMSLKECADDVELTMDLNFYVFLIPKRSKRRHPKLTVTMIW